MTAEQLTPVIRLEEHSERLFQALMCVHIKITDLNIKTSKDLNLINFSVQGFPQSHQVSDLQVVEYKLCFVLVGAPYTEHIEFLWQTLYKNRIILAQRYSNQTYPKTRVYLTHIYFRDLSVLNFNVKNLTHKMANSNQLGLSELWVQNDQIVLPILRSLSHNPSTIGRISGDPVSTGFAPENAVFHS